MSHPDVGAVVIKSIGVSDKEPLLPVTIHATSATGMQGQQRKSVLTSPNQQVQQVQQLIRASDKDTV